MDTVLLSNLVERQVPDFIRADHNTFVTFLKKYYEWLESNSGVLAEIQNLKNATDIDTANNFYINLLNNDFLAFFPQDFLADKKLFLKLVTQFYKANGTPKSIKFLFRALFNENIEIYFPKDDILKTSDGKWVLPLALRIDTDDANIFNIEKTLITGLVSKATALVEKITQSIDRQLGISYTELYVSNVERLFETGETITAVYNNGVVDVTVTGRLVGALSKIDINPRARGLGYNEGDPVTIIGGLNPNANNPIGALAEVGEVERGSVRSINLLNGGIGFRKESDIDPLLNDKVITFDYRGGHKVPSVSGETSGLSEATAELILVDEDSVRAVNTSILTLEVLDSSTPNLAYLADIVGTGVGANTADPNSATILEVISSDYQTFNVYAMTYVDVSSGGGGYRTVPTIETYSWYNEDLEDDILTSSGANVLFTIIYNNDEINLSSEYGIDLRNIFEKDDYVELFRDSGNETFADIYRVKEVAELSMTFTESFPYNKNDVKIRTIQRNNLYNLGSIGRFNIISGGTGYANGETLIFTGGSGYGANAYINVNPSTGEITTVTLQQPNTDFLLGGEGYKYDSLPTITIDTVSGANAEIVVSEVMGDGESYEVGTTRVGAISTIKILSYGYDYVDTPIVSLRNMDLIVSNVTEGQLFVSNTRVYQGNSNTDYSFIAYVDNYEQTTTTSGTLRLFDYKKQIDSTIELKSEEEISGSPKITANIGSVTIYGDGRAKANATFENGLIRYPGLYINDDGHLSAKKYLQDDDKYHNFSYELVTKTDTTKFKKSLKDISHPVGTKSFILRTSTNENTLIQSDQANSYIILDMPDSYNIAIGANSITSTNASDPDISQFEGYHSLETYTVNINVGDTIILNSVYRPVTNDSATLVIGVEEDSNVVTGISNSNFINDIVDGDTILIANTDNLIQNVITTVDSVVSYNTFITLDTITFTGNVVLNVITNQARTVTFVNTDTILVDYDYFSEGTYLQAQLQKRV